MFIRLFIICCLLPAMVLLPGCSGSDDTPDEGDDTIGEFIANSDVHTLLANAIEDTGLTVKRKAIRGGTDGSVLTQLGHPTPNLFAGGVNFHSRREWVAERSMVQATETILHLAHRWIP